MRFIRVTRLASLAIITALLISGASIGAEAESDAQPSPRPSFPSLRLIVTESEIDQVRSPEGSFVLEGLPSFVAATGGEFEVHVNRQRDGEITARQIVRDDAGEIARTRRLPGWTVPDLSQGFDAFFNVTMSTEAGGVVHSADIPFCPLTWDRARLDDTGPSTSEFADSCVVSELTTGMVWGIDAGWTGRAPDSIFVDRAVPDGTYRLDIEIKPRYRRLFGIPANRARASMAVTVATGDETDGGLGDLATGPPVGDIHGLAAQTPQAPEVAADASGLPDLIALPPFNIMMAGPDDPGSEGVDAIIFGANVWNGGDGPLVVEGFRRLGEPVMDAYQYLYQDGVIVSRELVGELEYDPVPGHRHWHFKDFAQYRIIDDAGNPVAVSGKEAFCLMPTDPIDLTIPHADYRPSDAALETRCGFFGAMWIREILQVGWGDSYYQSVPGQWIDITDVPNGEYLLEVATNQDGRLEEIRSDNNVALRRIALGGEPGARTVEVVGE